MNSMKEFNSQICTTREQSERLLALGLKKETADMCWWDNGYGSCAIISRPAEKEDGEYGKVLPAWSLHRLIELCPYVIKSLPALHLTMSSDSVFYCTEDNNEEYEKPFSRYTNMYDNYIECIEWLIKEGYFNKEYLVDQEAIEEHCKGVLEYLDYIRKED